MRTPQSGSETAYGITGRNDSGLLPSAAQWFLGHVSSIFASRIGARTIKTPRAEVGPLATRFGGRYLVRGGKLEVLEGAHFMRFIGISQPGEFREVTRSHVIAWRDDLASRGLSSQTLRHRLAALSSLFEHLCESNAITHNPSRV